MSVVKNTYYMSYKKFFVVFIITVVFVSGLFLFKDKLLLGLDRLGIFANVNETIKIADDEFSALTDQNLDTSTNSPYVLKPIISDCMISFSRCYQENDDDISSAAKIKLMESYDFYFQYNESYLLENVKVGEQNLPEYLLELGQTYDINPLVVLTLIEIQTGKFNDFELSDSFPILNRPEPTEQEQLEATFSELRQLIDKYQGLNSLGNLPKNQVKFGENLYQIEADEGGMEINSASLALLEYIHKYSNTEEEFSYVVTTKPESSSMSFITNYQLFFRVEPRATKYIGM